MDTNPAGAKHGISKNARIRIYGPLERICACTPTERSLTTLEGDHERKKILWGHQIYRARCTPCACTCTWHDLQEASVLVLEGVQGERLCLQLENM